jgi:PAS domain S-box-containing protein
MAPDYDFPEKALGRSDRSTPRSANENVYALDGAALSAHERERRFRELLDALPTAIYTTDTAGRLTYYNDGAAALWGHRPRLGLAESGVWQLFQPDGRPVADTDSPLIQALRENRRMRGEFLAEGADGTRVAFTATPTPLHDESGRLIGAVNMLVDITERKRAEDEQMLLTREVHHRVRNTLAIVQAVMGSTARTAPDINEFTTSLTGRIASLAKTNLLISEARRGSVSFGRILHNELDAFNDRNARHVAMDGPAVEIPAELAVPLGMAIHELTTNTARHGALSVTGGRVTITWKIADAGKRRYLDIDWRESGGPPVEVPQRNGFGTQLLEAVLPRQIQAIGAIDYQPGGVHVHYSVPLPPETRAQREDT